MRSTAQGVTHAVKKGQVLGGVQRARPGPAENFILIFIVALAYSVVIGAIFFEKELV